MLDINMKESLTTREIKRQEAIYELSRGEQDLIEDLKLARKVSVTLPQSASPSKDTSQLLKGGSLTLEVESSRVLLMAASLT